MRYFFIKDWVSTRDVELKHCSTTKILENHSAKPLWGDPFRKFRADLMHIPEDTDMTDMCWDRTEAKKGVSCKLYNDTDTAVPQECVGNNVKGTSMPDDSESEV